MRNRGYIRSIWASAVLILLTAVACAPKAEIPVGDFRDILGKVLDVNVLIEQDDSLNSAYHAGRLDPYVAILGEYGYSRAQFDSSLMFYLRHGDLLDSILDDVVAQLKQQEEAYRVEQVRLQEAESSQEGE